MSEKSCSDAFKLNLMYMCWMYIEFSQNLPVWEFQPLWPKLSSKIKCVVSWDTVYILIIASTHYSYMCISSSRVISSLEKSVDVIRWPVSTGWRKEPVFRWESTLLSSLSSTRRRSKLTSCVWTWWSMLSGQSYHISILTIRQSTIFSHLASSSSVVHKWAALVMLQLQNFRHKLWSMYKTFSHHNCCIKFTLEGCKVQYRE